MVRLVRHVVWWQGPYSLAGLLSSPTPSPPARRRRRGRPPAGPPAYSLCGRVGGLHTRGHTASRPTNLKPLPESVHVKPLCGNRNRHV